MRLLIGALILLVMGGLVLLAIVGAWTFASPVHSSQHVLNDPVFDTLNHAGGPPAAASSVQVERVDVFGDVAYPPPTQPSHGSQATMVWAKMLVMMVPFLMILATVAVICVALVVKSGRRERRGPAKESEAAMVEAIYHGLQRMEQRIEALETLVVTDRVDRSARTP